MIDDLRRLARNLWWCWDADAPRLFEELSPTDWEKCGHNPTLLLERLPPAVAEAAAADGPFQQRIEQALQRLDDYLATPDHRHESISRTRPVAYFCAEYGLHESLPLYSGGLGVLAGDHLKSASDIGIPLIAVGLFYRAGYMVQGIDEAGRQIAADRRNDPESMPLDLVTNEAGDPIEIALPLAESVVHLRAWRADVGRVSLYLLDTDTPSNGPEQRAITGALYGGAEETRIQQELVLGCGGVRLLAELGIRPSAWHMNEGHAAFLTVERAGQLVSEQGMPVDTAREHVAKTTLFTTHTPVPAGHDKFDHDLAERYLAGAAERMGLSWHDLAALGGSNGEPDRFNMTMLALRMSSYRNGVSQLHGMVSRRLLGGAWPDMAEDDVPVTSITNGIHLATWVHPSISGAVGATGRVVRGEDFATNAADVDPAELWRRRLPLRRNALAAVRESIEHGRAPLPEDALDERALLIGFARRFASYKRADLLLTDPERLVRLLGDPDRPVRILVAGKAHPRDRVGQDLLAEIVGAGRSELLRGRVFFLEDHSIQLGRTLVQGVDVWLNTPRRMQEASGTSGMKAAANGALNLSIADGWWPEAADGDNGWTIAPRRSHDDDSTQDPVDAQALYRCLEEQIQPLFFQRDENDVPVDWLRLVQHSLITIPPVFNTDRMVRQYLEQAYGPLSENAVSS